MKIKPPWCTKKCSLAQSQPELTAALFFDLAGVSPGNRGEEVVDVAWAPDVDEVVPAVGMHVGALKLNGKGQHFSCF